MTTTLKALLSVALIVGTAVALTDEGWRYSKTEKVLASNQHYFDFAQGQRPGRLSISTFSTFRLVSLLNDPYISDATENSFWSQLFARFWFDFEPRFLPRSQCSILIGRALLILGLLNVGLLVIGLSKLTRLIPAAGTLGLRVLIIAFVSVPILQTIRFPYFSSMKALFVLPAAMALVVAVAAGATSISRLRFGPQLLAGETLITLLIGFAHAVLVSSKVDEALNLMYSPQWPYPSP